MQRKASIEVNRAVVLVGRLNRDGWTQLVVELFEKRHDDVQAIGRAGLEDRHEDLPFLAARRCSTHQPGWCDADAGHCHSRGTKKEAAREHDYLRWKSGEPMTSVARIEGVVSLSCMP